MLENRPSALRPFIQSSLIALSFMLSACGSGGSDDNDAPSNPNPPVAQTSSSSVASNEPFSLTFTDEANSFNVDNSEGLDVFAPSIRIPATQTGTTDITPVYIFVDSDNEMFSDVSVNSLSNTDHIVTVQASRDLFPGTYTGELTLYVCADEECDEQLQEPQTTTYEVSYAPDEIVMRVIGDGAIMTRKYRIDGYTFSLFGILPAATNSIQETFDVEVYLPDENASYSFPQDMVDALNITNQTATGFTFTTPESPVGDNRYPFEMTLSDAGTINLILDFDVYPLFFDTLTYQVLDDSISTTLANGESVEVGIEIYSPSGAQSTLREKNDCGFWFRLDVFDNELPGFGIHTINADINTAFETPGTLTCPLELVDSDNTVLIEFDYTLTIE